MPIKYTKTALFISSALFAASSYAAVPNQFSAGQPARAADVNENFSHLTSEDTKLNTEVETLKADVSSVESSVSTLGGRITATETDIESVESSVSTLDSALSAAEIDIESVEGSVSTIDISLGMAETSIADNETAISANATAIQTLADMPEINPKEIVEIEVDCSSDPTALATAYHANSSAYGLQVEITGDCYGGFQLEEEESFLSGPTTMHFGINGSDAGGTIIPDPATNKASIAAFDSFLQLENLTFTVGVDDVVGVNIDNNASASINNVEFISTESRNPLRISDSSIADISNVVISGTSGDGIVVQRSSALYATDVTISGSAREGIDVKGNSNVTLDGTITIAGDLDLTQSTLNLGSGDTLSVEKLYINVSSSLFAFSSSHITASEEIEVNNNSTLEGREITSAGNIEVRQGSTFRAESSGSFVTITDGTLQIFGGSFAEISEGSLTSTSDYAIAVNFGSTLVIDDQDNLTPLEVNGNSTIQMAIFRAEDASFNGNFNLWDGAKLISYTSSFSNGVVVDGSSTHFDFE